MEQELDKILEEYEQGNMNLLTLKAKLLHLFSVSVSLPSKPFTGEMSAFLLVNILRNLTDEQQAQLCADIYVRSSKKDYIDKRIKEMQECNER